MAKTTKRTSRKATETATIIDAQAETIVDKFAPVETIAIEAIITEMHEEAQAPAETESAAAVAETNEAPAEDVPGASASTTQVGGIADLNAALSAVVAQYAPALTDAQKEEMLAADATLKEAVDAYNKLSEVQRDNFVAIVGIKTRRATKTGSAKTKVEVDPALKALACEVFTVTHPTQEQYAALARASAGEMPVPVDRTQINPIYLQDFDRYVDTPRAKDKRTNKRIQVAIDASDTAMLAEAVAFIEKVENYTGRRLCRSYGRLAQIAFEARANAAPAE